MPETAFRTPDGIEVVEDVSRDYRGTAVKFQTEETLTLHDDKDSRDTIETEYFIASAVTGFPTETMVFPAEEDGTEPVSWGEVAVIGVPDVELAMEHFADLYL